MSNNQWQFFKSIVLNRNNYDFYGTETRALKQAVKRNIERFPGDFMFELTEDEIQLNEQLDKTSKPGYKAQLRNEEEILHWLKNN